MRAVTIPSYGGPEVLTLADVDDPVPGPDEILVRVTHSACNRADTLQRMGGYPDPVRRDVEILGLEYAGTVAALGARVTNWEIGDRVMGIESGACYAELVATHCRQALPIPAAIATEDAAAIPEVFLTAWDALVVQGGLTSGRWALVHAGASGVGTAAIQIAKAIGARIAVTCSAGKVDACRGARRRPGDRAQPARLARRTPAGGAERRRRRARRRRWRGGRSQPARRSAPRASIVQVGLMGGGQTPVNVGLLLVKRITWIGTTLRARPIEQKIALCQRFAAEVLPLFESGALRPVIDSRYRLDAVADAHRHMEANANVGKILLEVA